VSDLAVGLGEQNERGGSAPFDYAALESTALERDPFDFLVVPNFVADQALPAVLTDFPRITGPGNFAPESLSFGPAFGAMLDELHSPRFAAHIGRKFGVDLTDCEAKIGIRGFCEASDGHVHTDHRSKIVTLLIYFNVDWASPDGQLRLLRSARDLDDYAQEVPPRAGTLLGFRRSGKSYHGHTTYIGERRMLQLSWAGHGGLYGLERRLNRATKPIRRLLNMS
jgi:hypothetical protein